MLNMKTDSWGNKILNRLLVVVISFMVYVVVQSPSHVQLFVTSWTAAHQASLSLTISRSLPKFMSITLVMPSSHLILWLPLLPLPSVFPSIRDFSSGLAICIRWAKYWNFSFSVSPSNEYSGLIFFRMNWFDLLAVQRTLKSLLQQFESINIFGAQPAFISVHDYRKKP